MPKRKMATYLISVLSSHKISIIFPTPKTPHTGRTPIMKKRLISLLLAIILLASFLPASAEYGKEKYEYIQQVADFIRNYGLYSDMEDDPLQRALIQLLEEDEAAFDILLSYMLASYDERTMLIPAEYLEQLLKTSGYVGVGMTITRYEGEPPQVTALHEQGSAKRAGVMVGDVLVSIGGQPVGELDLEQIGATLRDGEEGSFIRLVVLRGEKLLTFDLMRAFIGEPEYSCAEAEEGIWLMRWTSFKTAELLEDFHADIAKMAQSSAKSLIIDLRGNNGGLVSMAYDIIDSLIPDKDVHYLSVTYRDGEEVITEQVKSPGGGLALNSIIVLCDGDTASAAEIITTALCDTGHAVSVGQRTYGKGTAQYEIETPEESLMIITSFKMTSVTGYDYNILGLYPNYPVLNEERQRPATGLTLRDIDLPYGNCSDDAYALNMALGALGMMDKPQKDYRFGDDTQAAVNNFRQQRGIDAQSGIDRQTVALINEALRQLEATPEIYDYQMDKALELAREALSQELRYTVDEQGVYHNEP